MSSNTGLSDQLLAILRERSPHDVSVGELAEASGQDRRTVSTNVSNNSRRRKENPSSTSPWVHVRRTRHGVYRYEEFPVPAEPSLRSRAWSELGRDGDRVVLRCPDGGMFVAIAVRDLPL